MLVGLCSWYMRCLDAFPLYTKSLTSAAISLVGDGGAQYHEAVARAKRIGANVNLKSFNYNRRRGITNFTESALICGPMLHYGYEWLESTIPVAPTCSGVPTLWSWSASHAAAAHVLVNDFLFDAFFIAVMFISTGIGEGYTNQILPHFKKDYVPAVKTMWKANVLLVPLEFCIFRFLPLSLRVLAMNFVELLWDALASYMIHKRRKDETVGRVHQYATLYCHAT